MGQLPASLTIQKLGRARLKSRRAPIVFNQFAAACLFNGTDTERILACIQPLLAFGNRFKNGRIAFSKLFESFFDFVRAVEHASTMHQNQSHF